VPHHTAICTTEHLSTLYSKLWTSLESKNCDLCKNRSDLYYLKGVPVIARWNSGKREEQQLIRHIRAVPRGRSSGPFCSFHPFRTSLHHAPELEIAQKLTANPRETEFEPSAFSHPNSSTATGNIWVASPALDSDTIWARNTRRGSYQPRTASPSPFSTLVQQSTQFTPVQAKS